MEEKELPVLGVERDILYSELHLRGFDYRLGCHLLKNGGYTVYDKQHI